MAGRPVNLEMENHEWQKKDERDFSLGFWLEAYPRILLILWITMKAGYLPWK
jgi:hypothetical protein